MGKGYDIEDVHQWCKLFEGAWGAIIGILKLPLMSEPLELVKQSKVERLKQIMLLAHREVGRLTDRVKIPDHPIFMTPSGIEKGLPTLPKQ